jgi:hypothetical protein
MCRVGKYGVLSPCSCLCNVKAKSQSREYSAAPNQLWLFGPCGRVTYLRHGEVEAHALSTIHASFWYHHARH